MMKVVIKRQAHWAGSALKRGEGGVLLEPLSKVLGAFCLHVVVAKTARAHTHRSQAEASRAANTFIGRDAHLRV